MNLYNYKATIERVIDGDTILMNIDLGYKICWKIPCRLFGINTPELTSKSDRVRRKANRAKTYVMEQLAPGTVVMINSRELDKYGRPLADVYFGPEYSRHLNKEIIDNGLAVVYLPG